MDLKNRGNARVDVERALIVSKISFARLNADACKSGRGNEPCDLELVLRLCVLRNFYGLSDSVIMSGVYLPNQIQGIATTLGWFCNIKIESAN